MQLSSDEKQFVDAILYDPDDASNRLVYADWLEERGALEKSKFVREDHSSFRTGDCYDWEKAI